MELVVIKYAFFQIVSLLYVGLVMGMYYSKKKLMTLENYIFSTLLFLIFGTLLLDIGGIVLPSLVSSNIIIEIVNRAYMVFSNGWLILFAYYVFVVTSKKNQGYVSLKENTEKEYFKNVGFGFLAYLIIVIVCCFTLKIKSAVAIDGAILYVSYVTIALTLSSLIFNIIRTFGKGDKNKLIAPCLFILFFACAMLFRWLLPDILYVSTFMALTTVILSFTVENPDINLIRDLNDAKNSADIANSAKTDFLSNMSHEIRTPLNAIVGFSEALKDEDISDEAKDVVDDIIMSSNNLLGIVNGILDISKIESNSLEIVNSEYDPRKMFDEVIGLGRARLASRPIEFKVYIDDQLPSTLYGDHARLKQIIINLVTNATKYTKQGSINLTVAANNKGENVELVIKVSDTGAGIKKENLDRIFNNFQNNYKSSEENNGGVGLSICKNLIQLMNGSINVESEVGVGSTFTVVVEQKIVVKDQKQIKEEETRNEVVKFENKKVLVVDDNTVNLKVAVRLLQDYGINAETVSSGQDCITKVKTTKYDLIFMDDMMPKMSGTECFQIITGLPDFDTPVVALTANAITGMKEKYLSIGFNDYLAKPIDKNELTRITKKFLNGGIIEENVLHTENVKVEDVKPVSEVKEENVEETKEEPVNKPEEEVKEEIKEEVKKDNKENKSEDKKEEKVEEVVLESKEDIEETKEDVKEEPLEEIAIDEKEEAISKTAQINVEDIKSSSEEKGKKDADFLKSKGVDVDHGLELLFDMETYDMAMEEFVNNYPERKDKIKKYFKDKDMPNYAIEVHAMKSDSKYLGFMTLADLSYQHEMASKENRYDFVKDNIDSLFEESDKIYEISKEYMGM